LDRRALYCSESYTLKCGERKREFLAENFIELIGIS